MAKTYRAAIIGCGGRAIGRPDVAPDRANRTHAAAYMECDRTELVAAADFRREALDRLQTVSEVPGEHLYTDFRELIDREKPDIVSIGTQEEQRAEITVYAAENGVNAIFAEKPMAASMQEADAMVEAVERNGVAFNLGANRRWSSGYAKVRDLADGGELGPLRTIITHNMDPIFISGSHWFDLIQFLNCERRAVSVQAILTTGQDMVDGDVAGTDPGGHGTIQYENGVTAYALTTPRGMEQEILCEDGAISVFYNGRTWSVRRRTEIDRDALPESAPQQELAFIRENTTLKIVEDLVDSLDTGSPTLGGVRLARASTELIFAFMESHVRGGALVELPLTDCRLRLQRDYDPRTANFRPQDIGLRSRERGFHMPEYIG